MRYADLHTHTHFSFDSRATLAEHCQAAIDCGLSAIAITNHFDVDCILDGIYPPYLPHLDRAEIDAFRASYDGDLQIVRGVELGQAHVYAEFLPRILAAHEFEYVLASVHNLKDTPDFFFLRYDQMSNEHCHALIKRYFNELYEVAKLPGITTLAHLTYPIRYILWAGKNLDLRRYEKKIRDIYHVIIEQGVNLEINVSGLRKEGGQTLPSLDLIELYRDCGGKKVAIGSDAHLSSQIGIKVKEMTDFAISRGFEVYYPRTR